MGNCLNSTFETAGSLKSQPVSGTSKATSKASFSSNPSSQTCSTPSTLTVPSDSEKTPPESLATLQTEIEILSSSNAKPFAFSELKVATRNFCSDSFIGEGGFGCVYKGWIDEQSYAASKPGNGLAVAVKKLKPEGFQGHKEWLTEVSYLGQLQHPNLVKLIGYCSDGDNRLLVYEYLPKGSLENHLFKRATRPLSWALRMKVALGAARGLSVLHDAESQVIYRDVKASNILLDLEFNAKLSDFGLAKAGPTGDRTHVSTRVMGTKGYAAPEYIQTGRLSAKADVYSFGVVLLELLSGRPALQWSKIDMEQNRTEQYLVDWAKPYLGNKHKIFRIMDPRLEDQYSKKRARAVATLAMECIYSDAKYRPQMSQVVTTLEKLQDPKAAAKLDQPEQLNARPPVARSPRRKGLLPRSPYSPHQPAGSPLPSHRPSPLSVR